MSRRSVPHHVKHEHLELLSAATVTREGGYVRYLEGARYGLVTSVFVSETVPGSGPGPHTHPYAEFFVLHEGQGRYVVGDTGIDAEAGDVVVVPADAVHAFTNTGTGPLRHIAIHEAPVQETAFVDPAEGI